MDQITLNFNLICMGVRNGFKWLVENMIERKNKPQQPAKKLILLLEAEPAISK